MRKTFKISAVFVQKTLKLQSCLCNIVLRIADMTKKCEKFLLKLLLCYLCFLQKRTFEIAAVFVGEMRVLQRHSREKSGQTQYIIFLYFFLENTFTHHSILEAVKSLAPKIT